MCDWFSEQNSGALHGVWEGFRKHCMEFQRPNRGFQRNFRGVSKGLRCVTGDPGRFSEVFRGIPEGFLWVSEPLQGLSGEFLGGSENIRCITVVRCGFSGVSELLKVFSRLITLVNPMTYTQGSSNKQTHHLTVHSNIRLCKHEFHSNTNVIDVDSVTYTQESFYGTLNNPNSLISHTWSRYKLSLTPH